MNYTQLSRLRAKRGMAKEKAKLLEEYRIQHGIATHAALMCINVGSPPPQEKIEAMQKAQAEREAIGLKIVGICHPA